MLRCRFDLRGFESLSSPGSTGRSSNHRPWSICDGSGYGIPAFAGMIKIELKACVLSRRGAECEASWREAFWLKRCGAKRPWREASVARSVLGVTARKAAQGAARGGRDACRSQVGALWPRRLNLNQRLQIRWPGAGNDGIRGAWWSQPCGHPLWLGAPVVSAGALFAPRSGAFLLEISAAVLP
jgi:hypothetical protein